MYMIMLILDDCSCLDAVLNAWEAVGVSGITIVESTGIYRRRMQQARVPVRFNFERLVRSDQQGHYTLFAIVDCEDTIQKALTAAESVVGDLDEPNTGVLASWPLTVARGVPPCPTLDEETSR